MTHNVVKQRLPKAARFCVSKISDAFGNPLDLPCYAIFSLQYRKPTVNRKYAACNIIV